MLEQENIYIHEKEILIHLFSPNASYYTSVLFITIYIPSTLVDRLRPSNNVICIHFINAI